MNVTPLKAQRNALRTSFTCSAKQVDDEFDKENPDSKQLFILKAQLNDKFQLLEKCQNEMNDLILKDEKDEELFETDFLSAEKYQDRLLNSVLKLINWQRKRRQKL
ncbi:uncharacterized protein TNCV_3369281 [Trichonephila clavipes]|uniref:Uncharacterized protein n=1 Tax=Trichonephila clavipes TaxID=2585209 RepID=A0A8X6UTR3_TRICX|nr:uncharacterized protein TNCV_3369281 [Trichonephila clavipes]